MQKIERAALILAGADGGAMWSEEILFQPLLRVQAWVLMRTDVDAVIFDGSDELRAQLLAVYPEDRVISSADAANCEVGMTIAIPAPAFVTTDAMRGMIETVSTLGAMRLVRDGETIAYAAPGLLDEASVAAHDDGSSYVVDADEGSLVIGDYCALSQAEDRANAIVCRRLQRAGVRIVRPETVSIGADSVIEKGAVILPGCIIRHGSVVHAGAVIGPNTLLDDAEIGAGTTVNQSQVYSSKVGENTTVGPFTHVRPECDVGSECRIGAFVELKKSTIGDGTKAAHLTFVGDSTVGKNVNFGCGTITSNYDGLKKHRTVIGDGAFIGCNSNLIAPVTIGENAYTAAGATVVKDVPPESLYIARPETVIKEGWAKRVMALREAKRQKKG